MADNRLAGQVQWCYPNNSLGMFMNGPFEGFFIWKPTQLIQDAQNNLVSHTLLSLLRNPPDQSKCQPVPDSVSVSAAPHLLPPLLPGQLAVQGQPENRLLPLPIPNTPPICHPAHLPENQRLNQNRLLLPVSVVPPPSLRNATQNPIPNLPRQSVASTQTASREPAPNPTTVPMEMFLRMRSEKQAIEANFKKVERGESARHWHWKKKNDDVQKASDALQARIQEFEANTTQRTDQLNDRESQIIVREIRTRGREEEIQAHQDELDSQYAELQQNIDAYITLKNALDEDRHNFENQKEEELTGIEVYQAAFKEHRESLLADLLSKREQLKDETDIQQKMQNYYQAAYEQVEEKYKKFNEDAASFKQYETMRTGQLDDREKIVKVEEIRMKNTRKDNRDDRKKALEEVETKLEELKVKKEELEGLEDRHKKLESEVSSKAATLEDRETKINKASADLENWKKKLDLEQITQRNTRAANRRWKKEILEEVFNWQEQLEADSIEIVQKTGELEQREQQISATSEDLENRTAKLEIEEKELGVQKKEWEDKTEDCIRMHTELQESLASLEEAERGFQEKKKKEEEELEDRKKEISRKEAEVEDKERKIKEASDNRKTDLRFDEQTISTLTAQRVAQKEKRLRETSELLEIRKRKLESDEKEFERRKYTNRWKRTKEVAASILSGRNVQEIFTATEFLEVAKLAKQYEAEDMERAGPGTSEPGPAPKKPRKTTSA